MREVRLVRRTESYSWRGVPVTVDAELYVCATCGQDVFDHELDGRTLQKVKKIAEERGGSNA